MASLLTAMAALLTILEMRRQRVISYKPQLTLAPPRLHFERSSAAPGFLPVACRRDDVSPDTSRPGHPLVDCVNVGLGGARDLVATWSFDPQALVAAASPFLSSTAYTVSLDSAGFVVNFEENHELQSTHFLHAQSHAETRLLLPLQSSQSYCSMFSIAIPPVYLDVIALAVHALALTRSPDQTDWPEFPPLRLSIAYKDIGGDRHEARFDFSFEFFTLSCTTDDQGRQCLEHALAVSQVAES